jgi:MOSC domain-containing protein
MRDIPRLAGIRLHPIKSLDGVSVPECRIGPAGGLELDRVWALFSPDGRCLDGKSSAAIHLIRAKFAPDITSVTLSVSGNHRQIAPQEFGFPGDAASAGEWFSGYFDRRVLVKHAPEGMPDDTIRNGPMVISTASLQTVCDWFPGMSLEESRRRFRAPLEIGGVGAFWEDHLFGEHESNPVPFTIGAVQFHGTNPCPRCAVPARDSRSGVDLTGFQKRFTDLRRAQYPSWAAVPDRIRHFYHLGINTKVAPAESGKLLRVGDVVQHDGRA